MRIERQLHHIDALPIALAFEQFAHGAAAANLDLSFNALILARTVLLCCGLRRIAATPRDTADGLAFFIDNYLLKSLFNMGLAQFFKEIDFYPIER